MGAQRFQGVCKLPENGQRPRSIDIKVYPLSQQGFALLNYTGSEIFNEWMRIRASNHGFNLTDATLEYEESTSPTSWQDFNQNIRKDLEDLVKK